MNKYIFSKTLAILISAALMLALLPTGLIYVSAATASSGTCGDNLTWELDDEGNLTISGTGDIDATSKPWGNGISSLTVLNGVTGIPDNAFYGCSDLNNITIPRSVIRVGKNAFYNTGYYNDEANWENNTLYISGWLIKTNSSEFYRIKDGTIGIADSAFKGQTYRSNIYFPNSLKVIGEEAFSGCRYLSNIFYGDGDSVYGKNSGLMYIGRSAFYDCISLTRFNIPPRVESIGGSAFSGCKYIKLGVFDGSYGKSFAVNNNYNYIKIGTVKKGDPDMDGSITIDDALIALRVAVRIDGSSRFLVNTCEVDGDGEITLADALMILRVAAKIVNSL